LASKLSTLGHLTLLSKLSKRSLRLCHFFKLIVQKEACSAPDGFPLKHMVTFKGHLAKISLYGNFHAMAGKNLG